MKKSIFLLLAMAVSGMTAFGQLRVSNGYGEKLTVTIGNESREIAVNELQQFSVRTQSVTLKCKTNGTTFTVTKTVPRSGLITIEPSDNQNGTAANRQQAKTTTTKADVTTATKELPLIYKGNTSFKIFSETGRGLEFFADSVTENIQEAYFISAPTNKDLVIGIGIRGDGEAIWRYAEIRKRVGPNDTAVNISDKDIRKMSTTQNKKLKIRLTAKNYKFFFNPTIGDPISLGFNGVSRPLEMPIGQFYIMGSFTDPAGMFHPTVFIPVHVTNDDKHLEINENNLKSAVEITW